MKPRCGNQKTAALTVTEVLIVIAALALLAAMFLPAFAAAKRKSSKIDCAANLKQIGICYRIWADDNNGRYPMQVSVTNGGAMELTFTGNVAASFRVLSNTLNNPAMLICPQDAKHYPAVNFDTLGNSNISYFINLDDHDTQPQAILSGDDNLIVNGKKVEPGILNLHSNDILAWTRERHRGAGNFMFGDGSVQQTTSDQLTSAARLATNRLVIP